PASPGSGRRKATGMASSLVPFAFAPARGVIPFLADGAARLAFLKLADLVTELGGLFVSLARDGLMQLLPHLDQLRLGLLALRQPPRCLTAVSRVAVDVFQERLQLLAKLLVVVGAAEPAAVAKLHKFDATQRAFPLVQCRGFFALFGLSEDAR